MTEYSRVIRLSGRDAKMGYRGHEAGLDVLVKLINAVPDAELVGLVSQLNDAIMRDRTFGSCESSRAKINEIAWGISIVLQRLTGEKNVSFLDLCMGSKFEVVAAVLLEKDEEGESLTLQLRKALRKFNDNELKDFAMDYCLPVYKNFTMGMSLEQMIQMVVDYAYRRDQLPKLLAEARRLRS